MNFKLKFNLTLLSEFKFYLLFFIITIPDRKGSDCAENSAAYVYYVFSYEPKWSQWARVADSYLPICWCNYYIALNLSSHVTSYYLQY